MHDNHILKIENLEKLEKLEHLRLDSNQISKIENLESLTKLKNLYLDNNLIHSLENLNQFRFMVEKLKYINILNNPFTKEKLLNTETLQTIGNDKKQLLERLMYSIEDRLKLKDLPLKVIFIGNSEAGKTSLAKKLIADDTKFAGEIGSTHGLKIRKWKYENNQQAFIYDFGGQDYYHAVYQMFFTFQTQYVLLWDAERDFCYKEIKDRKGIAFENKEEAYYNFSPPYWLGNIAYYKQRKAILQPKLQEDDKMQLITVQNIFGTENDKASYLSADLVNDININYQFQVGELHKKEMNVLNKQRLQFFTVVLKEEIQKLSTQQALTEEERQLLDKILAAINASEQKQNEFKITDFEKEFGGWSNLLIKVLHLRGIVLYFHEDKYLKNYIWIDPSKVASKIYEVLKKENLKDKDKKGRISEVAFEQLEGSSEALRHLMLKKEIVFKNIEHQNNETQKVEYIVPQYLPICDEREPLYALATLDMKNTACSSFYLRFKNYLPHGLMSRLICRFAKKNYEKKHFYRYELIFTLSDQDTQAAIAKVRLSLNLEKLLIEVHYKLLPFQTQHTEKVATYLFTSLLSAYWNIEHLDFYINLSYLLEEKRAVYRKNNDIEASNLLEIWEKDKIDRFVPKDMSISLDGAYYLRHYLTLRKTKYASRLPNTIVEANYWGIRDDKKLLEKALFNPFMASAAPKIRKVFIAYAEEDTTYRKALERFLVTLKQQKRINVWHAGLVLAHEEWDLKIQEQLESSDIVVLLVSQSFIASDYIYKKVMPRALNKVVANKGIIIPFLLKPCDWENWEITEDYTIPEAGTEDTEMANYHALPTQESKGLMPLSKWQHEDDAWLKLSDAIRKVCN